MHHIHLEQTPSTQEEVKKALKSGNGPFLISTDEQTAGVGRQGSQWLQFKEALAFSFTLTPNEQLTLTPLEVGILLSRFFKPKVHLKWPNDLLNEKNEKLGGILCQLVGSTIVVGIGLNLKTPKNHPEFPYPIAGLFDSNEILKDKIKQELPLEITNFIHQNRLSSDQVREEFLKSCVHRDKVVTISTNNDSVSGVFLGITKEGAAILEQEDKTKREVLSGSLTFNR